MSPIEPVTTIEVDARGLLCPLPVIRLAEAARDAPAGSRITILTSDPAARHDIPAWCRMRGHRLYETTETTETTEATEATEATDLAAPGELAGSCGSEPASSGGSHPTYLRFVVQVQPQPPKAAGSGS